MENSIHDSQHDLEHNSIHDDIWTIFQMHVVKQISAQKTWQDFIASLSTQFDWIPSAALQEIKAIDQDIIDLTSWWNDNTRLATKAKAKTKAIWIGLHEFANNDATTQTNFGFTIRGCFDYDDEHNFWVKQIAWQNAQSAIASDAIDEVQAIIKNLPIEQFEILDWILPLALSSFMVNEIITKFTEKENLLRDNKIVEVALGYMDGDYMGLVPITMVKEKDKE